MNILIYETSQHKKETYALKIAFESIGHDADVFDWPRYLYKYNSTSLINRIKDRLLFYFIANNINSDLIKVIKGKRYDLMIVVRGDHVSPKTISFAKTKIPLIVNWNSDDIFNPLNNTKYILQCFKQYDCHFSPRGHLREEYLRRGAKAFDVINWYYRPGLLFPPPALNQNKWTYDIAFLGGWSKRREALLTPLAGCDLNVWGGGWNRRKAGWKFLSSVDCKPQVNMTDMMGIFSATKININILTIENRDTTNFRNFEIPAAGGFQISERSEEILEFFREGKEIICFDDAEELKSKCDYYLKNDAERQKIAVNGYHRLINSNYSVEDRAKQIINYLYKS